MTKKIYTDRAECETEVKALNAARVRDNFEYVVGNNYEYGTGEMVQTGWYVGCCSND